ncbi:MAG: hypothetical protein MUC88_17670, partial [Planctomycetes bacterium]|nr:hypothetical protein [Planctomycetota bacterium]
MNKTDCLMRVTTLLCGVLALVWSGGPVARADFIYGPPTKVPNVSRPGASEPRISPDGLELYFVCFADSACPELWVARRSKIRDLWGTAVRVELPAGSARPIFDTACPSFDGLELYFGEGYPGLIVNTRLPCPAAPSGYGSGDLWVSRRTAKDTPWGKPQNLGPVLNTANFEGCPSISADGLSLYFASQRPGGYGYIDLYMTTRQSTDDAWGPPVNLGAPINTWNSEATPFISPDGLSLYYAVGDVQADIYVSTRATTSASWGTPVPFEPVSSSAAEWFLSFSTGDSTLYFTRQNDVFRPMTYDVWQVEVLPLADFNGDGKSDEKDYLTMTQHWGQDYGGCDIGPRPLGDGVLDVQDLIVFLETTEGRDVALSPPPHAAEVAPDVILQWTSPAFAPTSDIYLGISREAVTRADRANPQDVLVSKAQVGTTYDPEGLLDYSRTYYWRVDFVIPGPTPTIYAGPVLSFTTHAFAYPIQNVIATASPVKTVDGSGLDPSDGHSTDVRDMWQSTMAAPHWIQFQFDQAYSLHELWVWNSNQLIEPFIGFGARTVKIEYSTDGTAWTALANVPEFARAPGKPGYVPNTTVNFGGVSA